MINTNKLPIIAIATITILVAGGVVYLRINPGPGKQATVSTNQGKSPIYQQDNLTPAEKAAKRVFELDLAYYKTVSRNVEYKEVENDGYEAIVIVSAEIRKENKEWERFYTTIPTKLVKDSWTAKYESVSIGEYGESMYSGNRLQAWRDIKINGVKEIKLIDEPRDRGCAGIPITMKAEIQLEIENKGENQRIVELSGRKIGKAIEGANVPDGSPCGTSTVDISSEQSRLVIEPRTTKTYSVSGKLDYDFMRMHCCVYGKSTPTEFEISVNNDLINGFKWPGKWWLEHPQYIP